MAKSSDAETAGIQAEMISLGLVTGTTSSNVEIACRSIIPMFENERQLNPGHDLPVLNIVFHSPMSPKKADFSGFKTGAFSKRPPRLVVAVAVPTDVTSQNLKTVQTYIADTIHHAIDFGLVFLEKKHLKQDPTAYHEFAATVLRSAWPN